MAGVILTSWQKVEARAELYSNCVHLWRFSLKDASSLPGILSSDEKHRAERLRIAEKAQAFVVGRTRLRQILSFYLEHAPDELLFEYNEHGKPSLAGQSHNLFFNLSHSGGWGVCAVACCGDIGLDIEAVKQDLDVAALAERFFSTAENQWLRGVNYVRKQRSFYRLWTRKEAWLKGKGGGFSELYLGLDGAHLSHRFSSAQGWSLLNMPIAKGYVGALAVKGEFKRVERYSF